MRVFIVESVQTAWSNAATEANAEIHLIVKQAKLAKDFTEFIKNKLIGMIEYGDSNIGKAYIKSRFPEYSDKELKDVSARYYDSITDKKEELLSKRNIAFSEQDYKVIGDEVCADAQIFFRRYFLARFLKRLSNPLNKVSNEFKELFRNESELGLFYVEVTTPKSGQKRVTGPDIAASFRRHSAFSDPAKGAVTMSTFVEDLQKLGVNLGYDAINFGFHPELRQKKK